MSYSKRLKNLSKRYKDAEPRTGGYPPPGRYQAEITRAALEESNASFNQGHLQVSVHCQVLTGDHKGRKLPPYRIDLESDPETFDAMGALKGLFKTLEIEVSSLSEKSLKQALEQAVGSIVEVALVERKGYINTYINNLINAPDDDDEEDDEEEEEEEKPKKKASKKKSSKKKKASDEEEDEEEEDEEEEEDPFDEDDEDDDEWEDEDED